MKGEAKKGFQHGVVKEIDRNKREEEERRGNEAKVLPNHVCDQSLHRSSFGVLYATIN